MCDWTPWHRVGDCSTQIAKQSDYSETLARASLVCGAGNAGGTCCFSVPARRLFHCARSECGVDTAERRLRPFESNRCCANLWACGLDLARHSHTNSPRFVASG